MQNELFELAKRLEGYGGDRFVIESAVHDAVSGAWTLTVCNADAKQKEEKNASDQ